jgi:hypothetical protein
MAEIRWEALPPSSIHTWINDLIQYNPHLEIPLFPESQTELF